MSKNWVKIKTVNDVIATKTGDMDRLIRRTSQLSGIELKKQQDALYKAEIQKEEQLLEAYKEKKLKSKRLIKKAESIIAARKRAKLKQKEKEGSKNES